MKAFQVWLRPLGDFCRVRVEGAENARWLMRQLGDALVSPASPGPGEDGSRIGVFQIRYSPALTRLNLESRIRSMPEVRLMSQPE